MDFRIDPASAVPPFEQLRTQIVTGAREGALPAGMRLPPVRQLAQQLGLAANTVARSYRELEADGVIVTRGRSGSFIADSADAALALAQQAARSYAQQLKRLGRGPDEAQALLAQAWDLPE